MRAWLARLLAASRRTLPARVRAGVFGDLVHYIVNSLNANLDLNDTVSASFVQSSAVGVQYYDFESGEAPWDGAMGALTTGAANLSVAFMITTRDRQRDVAFSPPLLSTGYSLLVRSSQRAPDLWRWTRPLSENAWGVVASAFVAYAIFVSLYDRNSPFGALATGPAPAAKREANLDIMLFRSMIAFNEKPTDNVPSTAARIVIIAFHFFALYYTAAYQSGLAALDVADSLNRGITSLTDLQLNNLPFGVLEGSTEYSFFARNPSFAVRVRGLRGRLCCARLRVHLRERAAPDCEERCVVRRIRPPHRAVVAPARASAAAAGTSIALTALTLA